MKAFIAYKGLDFQVVYDFQPDEHGNGLSAGTLIEEVYYGGCNVTHLVDLWDKFTDLEEKLNEELGL